ncbi:MAG: thioredoxin domain-containing protein, partial [Nitrososphaerales archaeon]
MDDKIPVVLRRNTHKFSDTNLRQSSIDLVTAIKRKANRLIREKSPYLLQHAYNPVDWFAWGDEGLGRAKSENKIILLSIGYSTCHWCHVMAHETFENDEAAEIINRDFIPIKVDREERPDIDEIYMKAVTSMVGQGGWPLTVFLTPDLKPFYGGTYFPLASFKSVLASVTEIWKKQRQDVFGQADSILENLKAIYSPSPQSSIVEYPIDAAYLTLVDSFDQIYGGFGSAPKFPTPSNLILLLRYYDRSKNHQALEMVAKTLEAMSSGGILDQLAGGFHRYSVDRGWVVSHFEKMLYDNALLTITYLEAHRCQPNGGFDGTARITLDWMTSEMRSREGAFYSAQDADSPEGEGAYYVWSKAEIEDILGPKDGAIISEWFGVGEEGNFEKEKSVLTTRTNPKDLAKKFGLSPAQLTTKLNKSRETLREARSLREKPQTDDKILTSWNGLTISAFAIGAQVLGDQKYLQVGKEAAEFVLGTLTKGGRLLRRYRDGDAGLEGMLEDYAFFIQGLLDLYEADLNVKWLREASRLALEMIDLFWDDSNGGFFFNGKNSSRDTILKIKEAYDGATPSGNSVAALSLLRLGVFTGKDEYREKGERTVASFFSRIENNPMAHSYLLSALDFLLRGSREIILAGTNTPILTDMLKEIWSRYIPNKVLALAGKEAEKIIPMVKGKTGSPVSVYVCENFVCKKPVAKLNELVAILE